MRELFILAFCAYSLYEVGGLSETIPSYLLISYSLIQVLLSTIYPAEIGLSHQAHLNIHSQHTLSAHLR